jgi:hypothetical protein
MNLGSSSTGKKRACSQFIGSYCEYYRKSQLLTQEIPVHRVLYRTRKDTVGQKIGELLKTLKMDKKWSGWVQNVKLC